MIERLLLKKSLLHQSLLLLHSLVLHSQALLKLKNFNWIVGAILGFLRDGVSLSIEEGRPSKNGRIWRGEKKKRGTQGGHEKGGLSGLTRVYIVWCTFSAIICRIAVACGLWGYLNRGLQCPAGLGIATGSEFPEFVGARP